MCGNRYTNIIMLTMSHIQYEKITMLLSYKKNFMSRHNHYQYFICKLGDQIPTKELCPKTLYSFNNL